MYCWYTFCWQNCNLFCTRDCWHLWLLVYLQHYKILCRKIWLHENMSFILLLMFYKSVNNVKCDLLFSRNVALTYGGAVHFSHFDITLDLSEVQSQVLTTNSHKCAALPGAPERSDLLRFKYWFDWNDFKKMIFFNCDNVGFFFNGKLRSEILYCWLHYSQSLWLEL